jgi:hypothetical protein
MNSIKSSASRVSSGQMPDVSETLFASIIKGMMVSERLGFCPELVERIL